MSANIPLVLLGGGALGSAGRFAVSELYQYHLQRAKERHSAHHVEQYLRQMEFELHRQMSDDSRKSGRAEALKHLPQRLYFDVPYATLTVNLLGALLMGIITGLLHRYDADGSVVISPLAEAVVTTGFLGCFTTFSSYALEVWILVELQDTQHRLAAALYVFLTNVLGGAVFVAGLMMSHWTELNAS